MKICLGNGVNLLKNRREICNILQYAIYSNVKFTHVWKIEPRFPFSHFPADTSVRKKGKRFKEV